MNRMLKNILSGIGSALVLFPTSGYTHYRPASEYDFDRKDIEALRSDAEAIGSDFHRAIEKNTNNGKKTN